MPTKKAAPKKTVTKKAATKKQSDKKVALKKTVAKKKPAVKKAPTKKASAKKAATKKTATKNRTAKTVKKSTKNLLYAADDKSFWVTNGEILNSLEALHVALDTMPKDVYEFHATGPQNDFSVWVETVLCDATCAADLAKAKSPKTAKTTVAKHLKSYTK